MTNNAFIYRRPSKWPIVIVLTAAVLIHLSAVAIAFHQKSPPYYQPRQILRSSEFTSLTIRQPRRQIPISLSRRPHRFRHPILSNLRKLVT